MADLEINVTWEDPQGARGAELRATWGRLMIVVRGRPLTLVHDYVAQSVRDGVYLPVYPLAEWIATHWWQLLHEIETPGRTTSSSYGSRHNVRLARDGFALPDLLLAPQGRTVRLEWRPLDLPTERVRFLQQGTAFLEFATVVDSLRDFVTTVVERLKLMGVVDTLLQKEWSAIEETTSDEAGFCKAAAALGHDPYALAEETAQEIVGAGEVLPESLRDDFFSVGELDQIGTQATKIREAIRQIERTPLDLAPLKELRKRVGQRTDYGTAPWQTGYRFARDLKATLGGPGVRTLTELATVLRLPEADLRAAMIVPEHNGCFFDALLAHNDKGSPGFFLDKRREEAQRFALCRALYEYFTSNQDAPALLTSSRSDRQKANRAFAAEFLAPAGELKAQLGSGSISEEGIEDLASAFNVSPYVIRHQIENHELARIVVE